MTNAVAPYNMINDNAVMLIFVLNIVSISYVFLLNGASIVERIKCLFYYENKTTPYNDRTHITHICNMLLHVQTVFYLTIIAMKFLQAEGIFCHSCGSLPYLVILPALFATAILIKRFLYDIVNSILFTEHDALVWRLFYLFTFKLLGFALAPAAIGVLFIPGIPFTYVEIYSILIFILYICTISNGLAKIIFHQKQNYLDIFLYLCALEFLTIAWVGKSVLQLNEFITIKI